MKRALVMSGGGAKGSFQAGALKAFEEAGIQFDMCYGTSVGAINAAGCAFLTADEIRDYWFSIKKRSDILSFNWTSLLFIAKGLYSTKPLRELLDDGFKGKLPKGDACAVTVSLNTGQIGYHYLSQMNDTEQFLDAVEASSAIPGIMEPVGDLVDGGIREVLPLEQAVLDGFKEIYVISCNPHPRKFSEFKPGSWFKNVMRAIDDVITVEIFENDLKLCDRAGLKIKVFAPSELLIDTLEFDHEKIKSAYKQGYNEVSHAVNK